MMFKKEKSFIAILCCIMLVCVPVIMVTHSFAAETQSPGDIVKNTKTDIENNTKQSISETQTSITNSAQSAVNDTTSNLSNSITSTVNETTKAINETTNKFFKGLFGGKKEQN